MKKERSKRLLIILIVIILTCAALPPGLALADEYQGGANTLRVEVKAGDAVARNVDVGICRVATLVVKVSGQVLYNLTPDFVGAVDRWPEKMDITSEEMRVLAAAMRNYAVQNNIDRITGRTDSNGVVVFEDLEPGMYLIMHENVTNTRFRFAPTLAPVGRRGYETAIVRPKTERLPTPTPTPTPSDTPTPTPTVTPTPTPTGTPTPTPTTEIPETTPPATGFPPEGDKPGQVPKTGVADFANIILLFAILGVLFVVIGLVQKKRSQKNNQFTAERNR